MLCKINVCICTYDREEELAFPHGSDASHQTDDEHSRPNTDHGYSSSVDDLIGRVQCADVQQLESVQVWQEPCSHGQ